jgi:DNA ligase-1
VKKKHAHAGWNDVLFCVFDIVAYGVYPVDVNAAWEMIGYDGGNIVGVQHTKVTTRGDIERAFHDVVSRGGEGVMLRHPRCVWMPRRSRDLVKVKPERDAEGVIIGYVPGAGRLTGMLGSLQLRLPSGQTFGLAGLSDAERSVGWECRFPIGATVTFKYSGLTADGIPREARFWRLRND